MKQIKRLFLPLVLVLTLALISGLLGWLPFAWRFPLETAAVLLGLIPIIRGIILSLREGKMDLEIPVLITIIILLFIRQTTIASLFTLLILLGQAFRVYILWRVEQSIREISKSLPQRAFRKTDEIREINISEIRKMDLLAVKEGGRIPVDGTLTTDQALVDESVITGESRLIPKKKGDHLIAGSINQGDYLEMEAVDTSENSTLAQIHNMVAEAQKHSTRLSRFTERFAILNSLAALAGAILIYLITGRLLQALAFWIALVPVIFAIIVPVATTIGISLLAKRGVMVKTAEALENLSRIDSIVLDKTGTLTEGTPSISNIQVLDPAQTEQQLLTLAASLEKYSGHPLSRPFLQRAAELMLKFQAVDQVREVQGRGISGLCQGRNLILGNQKMLESAGITLPAGLDQQVQSMEQLGNTSIFMAMDGRPAAIFFISDRLRDHIRWTMDQLKGMKMQLTMITGDNRVLAGQVAAQLGITRYYAETLPQDKISYIRKFRQEGEKVIMIGDGINDAPALSESNCRHCYGAEGPGYHPECRQGGPHP